MNKQVTTTEPRGRDGWQWFEAIATVLAIGCILLAIAGCSGGSSGGSSALAEGSGDSGELVLGITDAEGDFLMYEVDVTSIRLQHQNGSVVEVLPITTTIDFAQYVELSELLTIATVPAGIYESVELALDYSDANVIVQDENGNGLTAILQDVDGDPLSQLTVSIELSSGSQFRIAPGIPAQVTLDLDLDASNEIAIDNGIAVVTVEPVLLADTILESPKPFRLRGLLNEVVVDEQIFSIDIFPFRHRQLDFGSARVNVDEETLYEINGVAYESAEGLERLALQPENTPVVSGGVWIREEQQFTATTVYAGTSVAWSDSDVLRGVVVARDGNSLTLRGAIIDFADGTHIYRGEVTVSVGSDTTVTQQLQGYGNASIDNISVGSSITVSGELVDDLTMDATAGKVRITLSNLTGSVVTASPLSVELQRLTARNPIIYNFSGTGTDMASDADPDSYDVDTSVLSLGTVEIGDPIKVRGLVSAFGSSPEDFIAQTVLDVSEVKGYMVLGYSRAGSETAISQISDDGLLFDLMDAEGRTVIVRAGIVTQLGELDEMPLVVPAVDAGGIYALTRHGSIQVFRDFAEFARVLNDALADGQKVTRFDGQGYFDSAKNQFSSSRLRIGLTQ